ncbi:MAG: hypothetical protein AWU57_1517 [Marinobacter sp. T13-3]|nr:MAG: hypothetical protein AWU57_1517 [Marinobacter sp. T13-3]
MCNKNELANVPESVGEAIRANTNQHVTLFMKEDRQAVPSRKGKVEHMAELRSKYSDKPKHT